MLPLSIQCVHEGYPPTRPFGLRALPGCSQSELGEDRWNPQSRPRHKSQAGRKDFGGKTLERTKYRYSVRKDFKIQVHVCKGITDEHPRFLIVYDDVYKNSPSCYPWRFVSPYGVSKLEIKSRFFRIHDTAYDIGKLDVARGREVVQQNKGSVLFIVLSSL